MISISQLQWWFRSTMKHSPTEVPQLCWLSGYIGYSHWFLIHAVQFQWSSLRSNLPPSLTVYWMVIIKCVTSGLTSVLQEMKHMNRMRIVAGKQFGNIELNIVNEVLYQCLDHLKDAHFHQNLKYKPLCCAPPVRSCVHLSDAIHERATTGISSKKCLGDWLRMTTVNLQHRHNIWMSPSRVLVLDQHDGKIYENSVCHKKGPRHISLLQVE